MNVLLIFLPTKTRNCCDKRKHNVILELPTEKNCENQKIRGGSRSFWWGVDDTNRPSNYTLIYSKLSYFCPKTWRISKGNGWLASEGFRDPRISVCFSTYYIFIVGCSKGGGGGGGGGNPIHLPWMRPWRLTDSWLWAGLHQRKNGEGFGLVTKIWIFSGLL